MNVGIDFHGCLDAHPDFFCRLSNKISNGGGKVHIISGMESLNLLEKLRELKIDIYYDKLFSIVDFHREQKTEMWQRVKPSGRKTWYCEESIWNATKGEYCAREKIDIHFDDTLEYAKYFPEFTTFIYVPKVGFEKFYHNFIML